MKGESLIIDIPEDDEARHAAAVDFAKVVPHARAAEGEPWWDPVDAMLILPDFPDSSLIMQGDLWALNSMSIYECCVGIRSMESDLAAHGAGLEGSQYSAD